MESLIIALRIVFALSVLAALLLPRMEGIAPQWKNAALLSALALTVLLTALRFNLRSRQPERVPASSG